MRRARGFTLIELMVGISLGLAVVGVVMATFLSQQRSMQVLDLGREASNATRDSAMVFQQTLGRAGYGIEPTAAFDFRQYSCPNWTAAAPCRDKIAGPDELVFVARDPFYYWPGDDNGATTAVYGCTTTTQCVGHAWQLKAFDATSVTIAARAGDLFLKGQVVEMTCEKGASPVMGTVTTTTAVAAAGDVTLALGTAVSGNPYKTNLGTGHPACFDGVLGTTMFLVNRYRFFVSNIGGTPWLMLDRGLDYNRNGTTPEVLASGTPDAADLIPIASGVEDLQVAYLIPPAPATVAAAAPDGASASPAVAANWIFGDAPGVLEEPNPGATAPTPRTTNIDPIRFNANPANIRGVRLRIMVRSLLPDRTVGATFTDPFQQLENRNSAAGIITGPYRRYPMSLTIATPNLNSKDPFVF